MPAQTFNLGRAIRGMAADSFRSIKSDELEITRRLEAEHGSVRGDPRFACRVPAGLLLRDLTAGTASAGGFLVNSTGLEYAPALRPRSVVLRAGAQVVPVKGGAVFVPRGASGITTAWLVNEATQASESQPVFGIVQPTPKMLSAYCEVSRQLLLQSNADAVLRQEILAAAATALDAAALNGSGASGEPLGIIGTPGIGSVTGTSLAYAGIVEFQQDVATAGAGHDPATCAYVAPLATASLLKQRQRVASTDSPLWRGALTAGRVDDIAAYATSNMPTANLLYGDFSTVQIVMWDLATIETDPFTKMKQNLIGVRLLLPLDVVLRHPAAFSLATGVT
jgi:HK97 family phage major capsid protein